MADRPTIGALRSKPGNEPRVSTPPEKPVEPAPVEETEKEEEPKVLAKTPAEEYRERLKASEISFEEATQIFDDVMDKGYHEVVVKLGKHGRAVFRTRQYGDHTRLQDQLERLAPKFAMITDDIINRYNLAASLYEWRGKILPHNDEKDFAAALDFVFKLPGPAYALLVNELAKIDAKIMVVFSNGAAENF
jgi:hypothetical protein